MVGTKLLATILDILFDDKMKSNTFALVDFLMGWYSNWNMLSILLEHGHFSKNFFANILTNLQKSIVNADSYLLFLALDSLIPNPIPILSSIKITFRTGLLSFDTAKDGIIRKSFMKSCY
jgi:hypothetical protein